MSCSLKDIALEAGVSEMSVSRALRNQAGISIDTRARILAVAERLGYRPDPRVSQLMTHLREAREKKTSETLGFIWSDGDQHSVQRNSYHRELRQGAAARALELGFRLDEFWMQEKGMTGKRLSEILLSRGIQAVIFTPIVQRVHGRASLEWDRFTAVVIGLGLWQPRLHRVHHHHYQSMLLALRELRRLGYQRIGFLIDTMLNERMNQAWRAAFLTNHPLPLAEAAKLLWVHDKATKAGQRSWLERARPEVVLSAVASPDLLPSPLPKGMPFASLNCSREMPDVLGVDQCTAALGVAAVETVAAQYWRNERGIPTEPRLVLVEGKWRTGTSGMAVSSQPGTH